MVFNREDWSSTLIFCFFYPFLSPELVAYSDNPVGSEKGILSVMCGGWQELGSRYWHLSVGFLYRSTTISFFLMKVSVSRNARVSLGLHFVFILGGSVGHCDCWVYFVEFI